MKRILFLVLTLAAFTACSKTEDNILWEKSLGPGEAHSIAPSGDTGFFCGGTLNGKPYIAYFNSKLQKRFEYSPEINGSVTSILVSGNRVISAGSSDGRMLIAAVDFHGNALWDTLLSFDFRVDRTSLCPDRAGGFLALGSGSCDSINPVICGFSFVKFSADGMITAINKAASEDFVRAGNICTDNTGNYYLALGRMVSGGKIKATVAAYDGYLRKLWETDLYNNPDFGASSLDVIAAASGNLLVSGYTEFRVKNGTNRSAFSASVSRTGQIIWKKYLEFSNMATSLVTDDAGTLYVLNSNCIILNRLIEEDGTITGILRTFAVCDPLRDKAFGNEVTIGHGGELLVAGSDKGAFYIVAKSPGELSPI